MTTGSAVQAQNNVMLTSTDGAVTTNDTVTAVAGSIEAKARDAVTITADVKANQNVTLTSEREGITQAATAGIQAQTVTAVSAKGVDLQGAHNQFDSITVQSSEANAPIQGSILVKDSADKLTVGIEPAINGDIVVENSKSQGLLQVSSELHAEGNGADVKGDITLKSDGSLQTDSKIAAANDVKLTSAAGDVFIRGDVSTGTQTADWNEAMSALEGTYNSLVIHAGGAIQEDAGVRIETPVVETYSGNGVSMESEKNGFGIFLADALEGRTEINGSVKAVTHYYANERDDAFTVGVGADVRGDAEFSNLDADGGLNILIWNPADENKEIKVLGGNGAEGNLVLQANKDVNLLGDSNAAHDIVIESADGSFSQDTMSACPSEKESTT